MKIRLLSFLFLLVLPLSLFSESNDLTEWMERAQKGETPKGVPFTSDPKNSMRSEFKPALPSDKTTQLYAGREMTNDLASGLFSSAAYLYESNKFYFMQEAKDDANAFENVRSLLEQSGVSSSVLQDLQAYASCRLKAPFGKPWQDWTDLEKSYWTQGECGWNELVFTKIPADLKSNAEAYYFYWLGVDSFRLGVHVPHLLKEGSDLQDLGTELGNGIDGFYYASTDYVNQLVTLEVATAVKTIANMKQKLDGSGLPLEDLDKISDAVLQIVDAAKNFKLLQK
jgi:hypothetical protein